MKTVLNYILMIFIVLLAVFASTAILVLLTSVMTWLIEVLFF